LGENIEIREEEDIEIREEPAPVTAICTISLRSAVEIDHSWKEMEHASNESRPNH
jgi:hypothetical protein